MRCEYGKHRGLCIMYNIYTSYRVHACTVGLSKCICLCMEAFFLLLWAAHTEHISSMMSFLNPTLFSLYIYVWDIKNDLLRKMQVFHLPWNYTYIFLTFLSSKNVQTPSEHLFVECSSSKSFQKGNSTYVSSEVEIYQSIVYYANIAFTLHCIYIVEAKG